VVFGDVVVDRAPGDAPGVPIPPSIVGARTTLLTLLTLDIRSNRPNSSVFVDINAFNSGETLTSASTEFICWEEVSLSGSNDGKFGIPNPSPDGALPINSSFTGVGMGSRKGIIVAGPAMRDDGTPVTLLGLLEVLEGGPVDGSSEPGSMTLVPDPIGARRQYFYQFLNDSVPVPTTFVPF